MFKKIFDALAGLGGKKSGPTDVVGSAVARGVGPEKLALATECMERGNLLVGEGRLDLAMESFQSAVTANPVSAKAHNNLGSVLRAMRRHAEAEVILKKAISLDPGLSNGHYNLGVLFDDAGRLADAVAPFQAAVELDPGFEDAYRKLGSVFMRLGRYESEIDVLGAAIARFEPAAHWYLTLGMAQMNAKRLGEAITSYRTALTLDPDSDEAYFALGCIFGQEGPHLDDDEAFACLEKSNELNPVRWLSFYNLGCQYNRMCKPREAEPCFRKAIELAPSVVDSHVGLGVALAGQGRYGEAVVSYRKSLEISPGHGMASTSLAMLLLLFGDYREGLPMFEKRLRAAAFSKHAVDKDFRDQMLSSWPCWSGEPGCGKSLLVWQDHGIGDSIMCFRFLHLLLEAGFGRVTIVLTPGIKRLIENLPWPIQTVEREKVRPYGRFDCQIPICSLPWAFNVTPDSLPPFTPYLGMPKGMVDDWARRLNGAAGLRVGLVWGGNKDFHLNPVRSVPLDLFAPFMDLPGVCFVSLQKGEPVARLRELKFPILDLMDDCKDLLDTAALISNLDLVVSVDTSVAHMAGALGKPIWLLNRYDSDWRWMLGRKTSPWYPSMRIFRQPALYDWATVMEEVLLALEACAQEWSGTDAPLSAEGGLALFSGGAALPIDRAQEFRDWGDCLFAAGARHDAERSYRLALEENPMDDAAHVSLGCVFEAAGDMATAAGYFREAARINPDNPEANCNLGYSLQLAGDLEGALDLYRKALAVNPGCAEAHNLIGTIFQIRGDLNGALASHSRAIRFKEHYPAAQFNRAMCLLQSGNFELGWPAYEWRWKVQSFASSLPRGCSRPLWLGDADVAGKTVLLHSEQGMGDAIQFCRYAPMVSALGAWVVLAVPLALKGLLASLDGVHRVISDGDPVPEFDFQCPLMSLPLAFHTRLESVPAQVPYLRADGARVGVWRDRLPRDGLLKVGIVWRGNPTYYRDRQRSLELEWFLNLARPEVRLFSLQKELGANEMELLSKHPEILHLGGDLVSFADTAAVVELMDIIISVDTATAHLAGALNKPVCVMLPSYADWRWLLDRRDSPWYPGAKLFRQLKEGDWADVMALLAERLDAEVSLRAATV